MRNTLKEFESSGYNIRILEAKGSDARNFFHMQEGGAGTIEMMEVLACQTTMIDDMAITAEDLAELPMLVYIEIMKAQTVNFTGTDH